MLRVSQVGLDFPHHTNPFVHISPAQQVSNLPDLDLLVDITHQRIILLLCYRLLYAVKTAEYFLERVNLFEQFELRQTKI